MSSATGRNSNVTLFAFPSRNKHLLHVLSFSFTSALKPIWHRLSVAVWPVPLAQSNPSEVPCDSPDWDNLLSFMDFASYVGPLGTFWQVMIEFTACFFPFFVRFVRSLSDLDLWQWDVSFWVFFFCCFCLPSWFCLPSAAESRFFCSTAFGDLQWDKREQPQVVPGKVRVGYQEEFLLRAVIHWTGCPGSGGIPVPGVFKEKVDVGLRDMDSGQHW